MAVAMALVVFVLVLVLAVVVVAAVVTPVVATVVMPATTTVAGAIRRRILIVIPAILNKIHWLAAGVVGAAVLGPLLGVARRYAQIDRRALCLLYTSPSPRDS